MTRAAPFGFNKVVFLSHVVGNGGPVFPGDPPVEIHPAATIERDGYYLQKLVIGEQGGTHWAAPAHFRSGHAAADELDPADFFHPAVVLDVRAPAAEDADFTLGVGEIREWEANFGPIPRAAPSSCGRAGRTDGRPGGVPERGSGRRVALPGFRRPGHPLADRAPLDRRARDRHDGHRPRRRHLIPRQPAAASGSSHPSGEPVRTRRDAAGRRLDHRRRNPDPVLPGSPATVFGLIP